ncbi:hypothetical protein PsYK624_013170 [Phanerochaete sordida]|uniref:MYND-type domain-containing protein n=1 Tax=Phanerochaete sordida TaxID=48140 RepID=A0A9P3L879_9APHY|nr:hypothetical protein PsYK624_013170 [Phanerochaete sordida]
MSGFAGLTSSPVSPDRGPQAEPDSYPETMDDWLAEPDLWPAKLRGLFEHAKSRPQATKAGLLIALKLVSEAAEETWQAAWAAGFVSQLSRIVQSEYVCGFSREELVAYGGEHRDTLDVLIGFMELFIRCLDRMPDDNVSQASDAELERMLDFLQHGHRVLFTNLWNIRVPFLVSEYSCTNHLSWCGESLARTLTFMAMHVSSCLSKRRGIRIDPVTSHIPHVLLIFWLHNRNKYRRRHALKVLEPILDTTHHPGLGESLITSITKPKAIGKALLRDLKDDTIVGNNLCTLLWGYLKINAQLDTEVADSVAVPLFLAAARRELCSGDGSVQTASTIIHVAHTFIVGTFVQAIEADEVLPKITAAQLYSTLALTARGLRFFIEDGAYEEGSRDELHVLLLHCIQELKEHAPTSEPAALRSLRRHTYTTWQASADDIARERLAQRYPRWQPLLATWRIIGDAVRPPPAPEDEPAAFGALERCAWARCLCSVHRPGHPMRVCKGCSAVGYCGPRCQKSDWDEGGHRERCNGRVPRPAVLPQSFPPFSGTWAPPST